MKKSIFLVAVVLLLASCGSSDQKQRVLRLSHPQPESHPIHAAMLDFANRINEKSDGKFKVEIFPNSQLGTPAGQIEMVQSGVVELVMSSFAMFESFSPVYKTFNVPYLYSGREHLLNALYSPEAYELYQTLTDAQFLLLAPFESGFRNMYSKKPIRSIEDMKGQKIRVQESETMINLINSLGGQATPLAYGEVFTAIQQNVLDGAENNPISYVATGHDEIAKYYSLTEHVSIPDGLIVSLSFYNTLSDEEKAMFIEAAQEATAEFSKSWEEINQKELQNAVENDGVEVITVDKAPFMEKAKNMQSDLANQGPEYKKILDYINSKK